jgi:hypothetical protein
MRTTDEFHQLMKLGVTFGLSPPEQLMVSA